MSERVVRGRELKPGGSAAVGWRRWPRCWLPRAILHVSSQNIPGNVQHFEAIRPGDDLKFLNSRDVPHRRMA
jgi:hypothetical protein